MKLPPVSVVTVTYDTYFFVRLLVEKVREFTRERAFEIIVVDRGSRDGTLEWLEAQRDVRVLSIPQVSGSHEHGEAAEEGARLARFATVALLDSDAHPIHPRWLDRTADRLNDVCRLIGPKYVSHHRGNPFGWYVHPHYMVFHKADVGDAIVLRKLRGEDTDTGEEATIRLLERGQTVEALPLASCPSLGADHELGAYARFSFGHPHFPTIGAGVFHAWYGTRLGKDTTTVAAETSGAISERSYREPLVATLREMYRLDY